MLSTGRDPQGPAHHLRTFAPQDADGRSDERPAPERKLPVTFINSDISREEKRQRYELLAQDALALIYMAPERFGDRVKPEEVEWLPKPGGRCFS